MTATTEVLYEPYCTKGPFYVTLAQVLVEMYPVYTDGVELPVLDAQGLVLEVGESARRHARAGRHLARRRLLTRDGRREGVTGCFDRRAVVCTAGAASRGERGVDLVADGVEVRLVDQLGADHPVTVHERAE